MATKGTTKYLNNAGIAAKRVNKVLEGRPHAVDAMLSGQIDLIFNTAQGVASIRDSLSLRQTALTNNIPYYTTIRGAKIAVDTIEHLKNNSLKVKSLQDLI